MTTKYCSIRFHSIISKTIHFLVSKVWDWNSASVKQSGETKFLLSCKSDKNGDCQQFFQQNFLQRRSTFHTRGGYVNKHNCRIWGSEKSQVIEERPLHSEKVDNPLHRG